MIETRHQRYLDPILATAAFLLLWEVVARFVLSSGSDFPPVSAVIGQLFLDLANPRLWQGLWMTLLAWGAGMALVLLIALPLGLLLGVSDLLYRGTGLTIEFIRTIPSIAALPILIFVYGVGFRLTLVLVVLTAVWPLLIQVMHGVHNVDPVTRDTARVYGLSRIQVFNRVILPGSMPYIATGLRLSGTIALIFAVATSLIAGGEGLGALIGSAANGGQSALMYARIFLSGVLGLLVTWLLVSIEKRMLHWHPSQLKEK